VPGGFNNKLFATKINSLSLIPVNFIYTCVDEKDPTINLPAIASSICFCCKSANHQY